jgi:hypothetical protein
MRLTKKHIKSVLYQKKKLIAKGCNEILLLTFKLGFFYRLWVFFQIYIIQFIKINKIEKSTCIRQVD